MYYSQPMNGYDQMVYDVYANDTKVRSSMTLEQAREHMDFLLKLGVVQHTSIVANKPDWGHFDEVQSPKTA